MSRPPVAGAESTRMFQEAAAASDAVRAQLDSDSAGIAKYLIETRAGVLTASAAPSVSSIYGVAQDLRGCLFIALSQSGRSPDLLASVAAAKAAGATILALCNTADAPLNAAADFVIELRAGVETSVAATKSYLATLAALVRMV